MAAEAPQLGFAAGIGADHADRGQVLLDRRGQLGDALLHLLETVVGAPAIVAHCQRDQRRRQEDERRELPVGRAHDGEHDGEGQGGLEQEHEPWAEHHADGIEIVDRARHQVAR